MQKNIIMKAWIEYKEIINVDQKNVYIICKVTGREIRFPRKEITKSNTGNLIFVPVWLLKKIYKEDFENVIKK